MFDASGNEMCTYLWTEGVLCNMVRNLACGMHARIDRATTPLPSLDARRLRGLN